MKRAHRQAVAFKFSAPQPRFNHDDSFAFHLTQ